MLQFGCTYFPFGKLLFGQRQLYQALHSTGMFLFRGRVAVMLGENHMSFDPRKHHRRSIRLKDYDYTQPGAYFVTILAWHRQEIFGQIQAGRIQLSPGGKVVWRVWENLPRHFKNVTLGNAIVMPNHFHGIIIIEGRGEASAKWVEGEVQTMTADASPLHGPKGTIPCSLGAIIQNFKSVSSRKIARAMGRTGSLVLQRNYYERVVRNEDEFRQIAEYIMNNPSAWDTDEENPHAW
jgi:putative transposase